MSPIILCYGGSDNCCKIAIALRIIGDMKRPREAHGNLLVGIFSLVLIFFVAAWVTVWLLIRSGWNPFGGAVAAYSGVALAITVGAMAVLAMFQWTRKP